MVQSVDLTIKTSQLTNLNDINRLLHETVAKERSIDAELEQLLSKREDIEAGLLVLHSATAETLEVVRADADQLAGSVRGTSDLSERVSKKVRELDTAQSRIRSTLARINIIVDRTSALDGVTQAMESEDYEAAAEFVRQFLELEEKYGPTKDDLDTKQAMQQRKTLLGAKSSLEEIVRRKLADATQKNDHVAVIRFTRLFRPLRLQEEGLKVFTSYLRQLIAARAKDDYSHLVETTGGHEPDFVGTLTDLFKDIAVAVEENEEFLHEAFGADAILDVILGLQQECDAQGTRIVQRFISYRRLPQTMKEISNVSAAKRMEGSADGMAPVDSRKVEGCLEEMLLVCQRSEEYNQFMLAKMSGAVAPKALGASRENTFRSGQFNVVVRELIAYYINMEEFYLEQNVEKAVRIDEWAGEALTTSMVDDVFFILQKCGRRALATRSVQCVCAILGQLNNLLDTNLRRALDSAWRPASTRLLQAAAAALGEEHVAAATTNTTAHVINAAESAAAFNNADTSSMYVLKLRQELEEFTSQLFTALNDRDRIKSVLADLTKTSSDFKQITSRALDHLATGIMPRLRPVLDAVASVSYELSEDEYGANEVEEGWVQQLLASLVTLLQWLQPLLTPTNFDALVAAVLEKVVDRLEAIMQLKHFNQLGGLQLDRDVRTLTSTMSEVTQRTVRDKFAKLSQMATILSLESAGEMLDYWGENAGPITWRLTEVQVREVLGQRRDFTREEIASLAL
ncbi:hypothetical protein WJX72_009198 [[Myrmecia] bisecta]|uniref:Conserved oligomeric Golgi complex subunit 4 n=1 Tax=[Myrmecia] bisecta TaxID=41462 RepID=A0AAW1R8C6_9CHLO